MITGYIGVPGCGKTTLLSKIAYKNLLKIEKGRSQYNKIYANFDCKGCFKINVKDLGLYYFHDCLILLDELAIDADSRNYKSFSDKLKTFFILHRHYGIDIVYVTQDPARVDKVIRNLTYSLWYLNRPVLPFFRRFIVAKRIFRNININEYTSELTLGYRFCKFLEALFSVGGCKQIVYAPKYYHMFDSYEDYGASELPEYTDIPCFGE